MGGSCRPVIARTERRSNPEIGALDCPRSSLAMTTKETWPTRRTAARFPPLEDWQHWTLVMGRAQQMLMEILGRPDEAGPADAAVRHSPKAFGFAEPARRYRSDGADERGRPGLGQGSRDVGRDDRQASTAAPGPHEDRRFAAPEWSDNPIFDTISKAICRFRTSCLARSTRSRGRRRCARVAFRDPASSTR